MKSQTLKSILLATSIAAMGPAQAQRSSVEGLPNSGDRVQVVNKITFDSRTGATTSGNSFGLKHRYTVLKKGTVSSLYVPHSDPSMRLWFVGTTKAFYTGPGRQKVCRSASTYGGDWRTVQGTMKVEITTTSTGRKRVRAFFTPSSRDPNAGLAVSGLVFDYVLVYGDARFRFNY